MRKILFATALCLFMSGISYCSEEKAEEIKSPKEIYMMYNQALRESDTDTFRDCFSSRKKMDDKELKHTMQIKQLLLPDDVKIVMLTYKKKRKNPRAILYARGKILNPKTQKVETSSGKITMKKQKGSWKVIKENWSFKEPQKTSFGKIGNSSSYRS